jgi:phenylpropionate dioxygenase-like ring-hydroxylating dioxygenase large terminal subunit
MDRNLELAILDEFFDHHGRRTTSMAAQPHRNPASVYIDPDRLKAETDTMLLGRPVLVALSPDLPAPGDYFAVEIAGTPLLLVRGEDAIVRCFLNACRHRGGRVADGRGRAGRAFACPYHSWTYDLDGRLLGQPQARGCFAGPGTAHSDLLPLPVAERFGMIFARLRGDEPIDVEESLTGLAPELASHQFDSYWFSAERSGEWSTNWKLAVDTFLEGYHIFALHRSSLSPVFLSTPCLTETTGDHGRMVVFRRSVTGLTELDRAEWRLRPHSTIVYRIFPNVVLNLPSSGHVELWRVEPVDENPGRCRVTVRFFVPAEPESAKGRSFWQKNIDLTTSVVFEEDFRQQEDIYRTLRTGLLPDVVYGRNEPSLIAQHEAYTRALSAGDPHPAAHVDRPRVMTSN